MADPTWGPKAAGMLGKPPLLYPENIPVLGCPLPQPQLGIRNSG